MTREGGRDVRCELCLLDELEVVVVRETSTLVILHLLGDIVEERTPLGRRSELGDVVVGHVHSLVGDHDHPRSRQVVEVVQVRRRGERGKVGRRLNERREASNVSFRTR